MSKLTQKQILLFCLTLIILFCIPIYTIVVSTDTLKDGTEFLFKVRAFDPYDMFRGNYLNISFEEQEIYGEFNTSSNNGHDDYYVTIGTNPDGFAYFSKISKSKPVGTSDYFKTTAYYYSYDNFYRVDTPTRYYMNEKKSFNAEQKYRENIQNTYVKVRVKDGKMVIVGVYVDNILIDTID